MSEPIDPWLLSRERGEDVSHVPADQRARYDQLADLIQTLPAESPRAGWKDRVLAELDKPRPSVTRTSWWQKPHGAIWLAVAALAVAAPSVAIVAWYRPTHKEMGAAVASVTSAPAKPIDTSMFRMDIRPSGKPSRGTAFVPQGVPGGSEPPIRPRSAHVGDTLVLQVKADAALEVRVYSDAGKPLARCSALVGCGLEMIDNAPWFHLEVPLRTSGRVSAFLFAGRSILPQQGLNADLLAAHKIGVETRELAVVRVD